MEKKSSQKEEIPSEISVVRNIPPDRDEIIRTAFLNEKYYLNAISSKYFTPAKRNEFRHKSVSNEL